MMVGTAGSDWGPAQLAWCRRTSPCSQACVQSKTWGLQKALKKAFGTAERFGKGLSGNRIALHPSAPQGTQWLPLLQEWSTSQTPLGSSLVPALWPQVTHLSHPCGCCCCPCPAQLCSPTAAGFSASLSCTGAKRPNTGGKLPPAFFWSWRGSSLALDILAGVLKAHMSDSEKQFTLILNGNLRPLLGNCSSHCNSPHNLLQIGLTIAR